jgi:Mrp family chromosome partitioning ATPase
MQAFMAQVTHTFDLVIFDAPMVLSLPEVAILAPHMDGVLLVHYPLRRDRDVLLQAKQSLDRRGAAVVGVVLNNVTEKAMSYYINYRYKGYQTPIVGQVTPDNGRTMQPIDMRPGENGRNWIPEPALHPAPGTSASRIQRTAKSGDVALTIFTASLQQRLAEQASHPGYQFLILDIELVNDATVPYTFHTEHTAVSITSQSEYSRALASLIEAPVRSSAEVPLLHGRQVYKYDAVSTRQLQEGLKEEEAIPANGIMRGLLVYQIPLDAHNYVFEYSSDNSTFTIPLGKA